MLKATFSFISLTGPTIRVMWFLPLILGVTDAFLTSPSIVKSIRAAPMISTHTPCRIHPGTAQVANLHKGGVVRSANVKYSEELLQITSKGIEGTYSSDEISRIQQLIQNLEQQGSGNLYLSDPLINGYYRVSYVIEGKGPNAGTPVGGAFRYGIGRAFFRTEDTFQHIVNGNTAVNMLYFTLLGCIKGCVTLRGDIEPMTDAERQSLVRRCGSRPDAFLPRGRGRPTRLAALFARLSPPPLQRSWGI